MAASWAPNTTEHVSHHIGNVTNTTIDLEHDLDLDLRYSKAVTVGLCVAYSVVFVIGITGNCFVVSVVYRSKRMRSPMNLFITNLACADLLVNVLCLPFTLIGNIMDAWVLGWFICKTVPYLQGVSVTASVYTLVTISMERCLAICYPMTWQMSSRSCKRIVVVIWTFSLVVTSPWAVYFQLITIDIDSDQHLVCTEMWPTAASGTVYFILAQLIICYLLPLLIITVCYHLIWRRVSHRSIPSESHVDGSIQLMIHRSKVKVVKMLFYVVMLFAISWLPLYTIVCWIKFGTSPTTPEFIYSLIPMAQWLGVSNSSINPILYAFLNQKFRSGFRAIVESRSCCSPLQYGYRAGRGSTVRSVKVNDVIVPRSASRCDRHKRALRRIRGGANNNMAACDVRRVDASPGCYGTMVKMVNVHNGGTMV